MSRRPLMALLSGGADAYGTYLLESDPHAEIGGLVVAEKARGRRRRGADVGRRSLGKGARVRVGAGPVEDRARRGPPVLRAARVLPYQDAAQFPESDQ